MKIHPAPVVVVLFIVVFGGFGLLMMAIGGPRDPNQEARRIKEAKYHAFLESRKSPEVRAMEAEDARQAAKDGHEYSGPQDNRGHSDE